MKQFMQLFKKVGGKEVLAQYARAHVLFFALTQTALQGFSKKSLEIVRLSVANKVLCKLRKKYKKLISDFVKDNPVSTVYHEDNAKRKIWICWFQGVENAPEIVIKCIDSIRKYYADREIIIITEKNYEDYVQFPDFICDKIRKGIISKTHMSDLLRLELLIRYGGTWMDSTILCTGRAPEYMFDSPLFMFQNLKPGLDGHCTEISNWFITSKSGNILLKLTLQLLYEYWRTHNSLIDYFIFHDFFRLAIETYPEEWEKVVPFSNSTPHILLLRLFERYNEEIWDATKMQTPIHKLTYKFEKDKTEIPDTYYQRIMK